jgi:[ribosomal protein S18]-alanine N-acetyltransferase
MTPRRMTVADLAQVADLEAAVQITPWSRAQILAICDLLGADYMAWVLENETQEIIGYLIGQRLLDEFEILTIGIDEAHQGRGLGFELLQYAWYDLRTTQPHIKTCFLEVRENNLAAQALYTRCGFEEVGRRRHYYQNPREDALILRKQDES